MDAYEDCGKMERSEILNPGVPTAARNGMPYPGSRKPPEARSGVVLPGPAGAASAAWNSVAYPDVLMEPLGSGVPPATRNAVSYGDGLTAHLSSGTRRAARDGVPYGDGVTARLGSGATPQPPNAVAVYPDVPTAHHGPGAAPVPRNSMAYADWLTAHFASGATVAAPNGGAYPDVVMENFASSVPGATRSGAPYSDVLTEHLGPGVFPGPGNGESYTDMLMAHLSSDMSLAAWNSVAYPGSGAPAGPDWSGVAYPGGLSADTMATDTSTVSYNIDVYEGVADFGFEHLLPAGIVAAGAQEDGAYYNNSGMALPFAGQVVDDADRDGLVADAVVAQDEVAGAVAERVRGGGLGGQLGLAATLLAVSGLTAGGAATPATAFALFATLLGGVMMVTVRVFRA